MSMRTWGSWLALAAALSGASCAAEYEPLSQEGDEAADSELGDVGQAVAACAGDDLQYDFNAFAASLAVAIANELGRWDVSADFEIRSGKLELSQTGSMRCN